MSLEYFKLIKGTLLLCGYQPDGDSVRFKPEDANHFADIHRGYRIRPSKKDGSLQLRLEGMDAPETHYGKDAQPYGDASRDALLRSLGFTNSTYEPDKKTVKICTPQTLEAAILTKGADMYGRPIAYLLKGHEFSWGQDGDVIQMSVEQLRVTVNYQQVRDGHSYALLYSSMPPSHRQAFRQAAKTAREAQKGLWPEDHTDCFVLENQGSVGKDGALIFPKLFRRCTDFLKASGPAVAGFGLTEWLRETPQEDDELFIESGGTDPAMIVRLHTLLQQQNSKLVLYTDILDVVFIEK